MLDFCDHITHLSLSPSFSRLSHVHTQWVFLTCTHWRLIDVQMVTFYLPPTPRYTETHSNGGREKTWASINQSNCWAICSYLSVSILLHYRWGFQHSCKLTDIQMERGRGRGRESERGSSPPLSPLHPAVSAFLLFPPAPIPRLPLGIECSQSGRWAECIIHRLFWGAGGARACVCALSPGGVGCGVIIDLMAVF